MGNNIQSLNLWFNRNIYGPVAQVVAHRLGIFLKWRGSRVRLPAGPPEEFLTPYY